MELINYDSFTTDQLKSIKDNIDRRLNDGNLTITPPPPICIKVISNADTANSLDKKGLMYNKPVNGDAFDYTWYGESLDELIEQNSNTVSGSVAFSYRQSIYRYYSTDKAYIDKYDEHDRNINFHSVRPVFLFKE